MEAGQIAGRRRRGWVRLTVMTVERPDPPMVAQEREMLLTSLCYIKISSAASHDDYG
jgi:hypothetical protein